MATGTRWLIWSAALLLLAALAFSFNQATVISSASITLSGDSQQRGDLSIEEGAQHTGR